MILSNICKNCGKTKAELLGVVNKNDYLVKCLNCKRQALTPKSEGLHLA